MPAKRSRDYRKEYDDFHGTPAQKKRRAARGRSRYKLEKQGKVSKGDGKDVHHSDHNPTNTSASNLKVQSKSKNRKNQKRGKSK